MKEYTVHFIRADEQPEEIYYYHTVEEAKWHLHLFDEDDSELYQKIEVRDRVGNVLDKIIFEVVDMSNWREWKIGDTIRYSWNEFDGSGSTVGIVTALAIIVGAILLVAGVVFVQEAERKVPVRKEVSAHNDWCHPHRQSRRAAKQTHTQHGTANHQSTAKRRTFF